MKKKKIISVVLLLFLAACDGESVEFEEEVDVSDQTLAIKGKTTLEDGSLINYEVINFNEGEILDDGQMEVNDGGFSTEIDASDYSRGEFEIYIAFLPYVQDNDIQDVYGESGENLNGDKVNKLEDAEDVKVIESRRTFKKQ